MSRSALMAISPIDGRYHDKTLPLATIFSEFGLIKYRLYVEITWFIHLSKHPKIKELPHFNEVVTNKLQAIYENFSEEQAEQIKAIEQQTNHDVKAVEYYLQTVFDTIPELSPYKSFIHFACTSEDINNLAYALMIKTAQQQVLMPLMQELNAQFAQLAQNYRNTVLMSRTHGQPATPTTMGKEFNNIHYRLYRQLEQLQQVNYLGKINGAVGNFNAHLAAYPEVNWQIMAQAVVLDLGLTYNPYTTQIEPHDFIAEWLDNLHRFNVICLDSAKDIWAYIALGHFKQKLAANEVGSSTMPHKVNPIDFENAEGNLGIANALYQHFSQKLPVSRWQRDLTDSTVLRSLGVAVSHSYIAWRALIKGLGKLEINEAQLIAELQQNWELMAEPVQTVMRRYGIDDAYEQLKGLTRGKQLTQQAFIDFVKALDIPEQGKQQLLTLSPETYLGYAKQFNVQE